MAGSVLTSATSKNSGQRNMASSSSTACNTLHATHCETLMRGLNTLRCAQQLFDVTFIVEKRAFKAHRLILAACSDYFCAMFTDMAFNEAKQAEIQLNGVNAEGFEILLEYAYTGSLELSNQNLQDVLAVATHIQMPAVVESCSKFLEAQIDVENCVGIAELGEMYSLDTLKKKAYYFICTRLEKFSQTSELYKLSINQLEFILSCDFPVDCTELRVLEITMKYCQELAVSQNAISSLFQHINFSQITHDELKLLIKQLETCSAQQMQEYDNKIFKQLLSTELLEKQQKMRKTKCITVHTDNAITHNEEDQLVTNNQIDEKEEILPADVLVNKRGMELALIKIGGFEVNGLTNQISCFLPSKGKWEYLTKIPHIEQCDYGTAVLGNDLIVVGGSYDVCLKEYIHPFGFRYSPTTNKWTSIAPIQADRCRFSLNAMGNNYLYAVGGVYEFNVNGEDNNYSWLFDQGRSNCERYNATTDCWEFIPALVENRSEHAGVVLGDKLYIGGGFGKHMVLSSFLCFNPQTNVWQTLAPMLAPRADHAFIPFNGRIYACGGWYEDPETELRVLAETIDVYDVERDQWTTETRNPMAQYHTGVAAVKRKIYFIGGLLSHATMNRATSAVQCYDLDTKEWSCPPACEYPRDVWECACSALYIPREHDMFD